MQKVKKKTKKRKKNKDKNKERNKRIVKIKRKKEIIVQVIVIDI